MFSVPFDFKCSACGREPTGIDWGLCSLCVGFFCGDHLVVKKGVATCESCAVERKRREASSGISSADEEAVVALLRADVEATLGGGHEGTIVEAAACCRLYINELATYTDQVVNAVQQHFHDTLADTSWPSCPHHPNHPLWFSGDWWRCERVDEPIARLGDLRRVKERG